MAITNTDRILKLEEMVGYHTGEIRLAQQRLEQFNQLLDDLKAEAKSFAGKQGSIESRLVLAEHQIDELKTQQSKWSERHWSVVLALITAVLGVAVGYALPR